MKLAALAGLAAVLPLTVVAAGVETPQNQHTVEQNTSQPMVVTGKDVTALLGTAPDRIVGFAWRDGQWVQVPVQVDQKVLAPKGQEAVTPPCR